MTDWGQKKPRPEQRYCECGDPIPRQNLSPHQYRKRKTCGKPACLYKNVNRKGGTAYKSWDQLSRSQKDRRAKQKREENTKTKTQNRKIAVSNFLSGRW